MHPLFPVFNTGISCILIQFVFMRRYARVMQQFGGSVGGPGFTASSGVFVPSVGLGAVDGGGMLGDIDAGFKVCGM
jgi:hypothetical protein